MCQRGESHINIVLNTDNFICKFHDCLISQDMREIFGWKQENNVKIVFGLEQQKHIETIERILSELGSNEYAWEKIGKEIGWCPKTACYHYVSYLRKLVFSA